MTLRIAALVAVITIVTGCAGGGLEGERIQKGMIAPVFVLSDISSDEDINSLKTIQSHHATVMAVWNSTCPSRAEALSDIRRVHGEYGPKSIAFLGINSDLENIRGVRMLIEEEGLEFPNLWDKGRRVTRDFKALDCCFSVFVVDRTGTVILAQYDYSSNLERKLTKTLDKVLEGVGK
jgi:hypothetical protein